MGNTTFMS